MKKIYYALLTLGLAVSSHCFATEATNSKPSFTRLDKIVAIVNREPITQSQLNKELEQTRKHIEQAHQPQPPQAELRKLVLENLIGKSLQLQICQAKGIKVPEKEVQTTMENIAKSNKLSIAQLKDAIQQTGLNFDDYKAQISEQLLLQKLQQDEVAKNVSLTPEDIKQFMRENKDKLNQYNAFHVIDIALPVNENASTNQVMAVKKQANDLAQQLKNGKDVDDTLKQYPGAEKSDLGWRSLAEIPSLFQPRVASMNVKGVSSPVQAPNGFHVLQLVEAKGDNIKPTETQLKNIVFQQKMANAVKDWLVKIRNDAYVKIIN